MVRAHYRYKINKEVLVIIDTDGPVSVTNDIENILTQIKRELGRGMPSLIIYKDSEGNFERVIPGAPLQFILLERTSDEDLAVRIVKRSS